MLSRQNAQDMLNIGKKEKEKEGKEVMFFFIVIQKSQILVESNGLGSIA